MKPLVGIALEIGSLVLVLASLIFIPPGQFPLYVIVVQFLSTYLLHCPGHYIVGRILGIEFIDIGFGRSTLANAFPGKLGKAAGLIPILTLRSDRHSVASKSGGRRFAMYASGTIFSIGSAFSLAIGVTHDGNWTAAIIAWIFALGYLGFDAVFSPRSGDLMRARRALMTP